MKLGHEGCVVQKTRALRERKPPPTPKFKPKVIRDAHPDFRINPDPDVCRSCRKMLWMHYLVGVSRFAKYGTNRPFIVWKILEMSKNHLYCNCEENEKVARNPHADPDHHQKLTTSRGSPLAHDGQIWSTSVFTFVSYPVYRMTDRTITYFSFQLPGGAVA